MKYYDEELVINPSRWAAIVIMLFGVMIMVMTLVGTQYFTS